MIRFLAAIALVLAPAAAASNSTSYPGGNGADPAAPHVTGVTVSNDDTEKLTFKVAIANRPALTTGNVVDVLLDTDNNPTTGSLGYEVLLAYSPSGVLFIKWNGSTFAPAPTPPSLQASYAPTGATITVNAADVGAGSSFGFYVFVGTSDGVNPAHTERTPESGEYTYQVKIAPKLTAGRLAKTAAKHGSAFTVRLPVTASDGPLGTAAAICTAKIAGRAVPARVRRVAGGSATCTFSLPASSKGKTVAGTIGVSVRGAKLVKAFSARIA